MKRGIIGAAILPLAAVTVLVWWWQVRGAGLPEPGKGKAPSNLLVFTFDTTRADHLSVYGGKAHVPNLERLAKEGVRFERAFSPTPLTLPSHVSLFTGLYPTTHGVRNNGKFRLGDEALTLAESLRERGFRTAAVIGAHVLDSQYGLDQGFELYDDRLPPEETVRTLYVERPASDVADQGLAWLTKRRQERWFLWLHFFDPHYEYVPPEPYRTQYASSLYDGEIAFADAQAGRVLEFLRERGWLDDTLIIMAGDHGESLGEHGERTHAIFIYDATAHVPLLMRYPARLGKPRSLGELTSLVDVMPTVLDLLEVPRAEMEFHGRSLLPLLSGERVAPRAVWLETWFPHLSYGWSKISGIRDLEWKYVRGAREELYELGSDPGELKNVVARELERAEEYRRRLLKLEQSIQPESGQDLSDTQEIDEEAREALRSLGYIDVASKQEVREGALPDPKDKIGEHEAMTRALSLMRKERPQEAVPILERAMAANPRSSYLHRNLGKAYRKLGRLEDAIAEFEESLKLDPDNFGTLTDFGSALFEASHIDRAEGHFKAALEINEHVAVAYFNLGLIEQGRDHPAEAVRLYERALEEDPNLLRALVNLGTLYEAAGRAAEAVPLYLRVTELDPSNEKAFFSAALVLFQSESYEEALDVLDRAQRAHPRSAKPALYKARVHEKRGDLAAAERELRLALRLDPGSEEARRHLQAIERRRRGGS